MQIPFSGFTDSNKFDDYQKLDQAFQIQRALQAQQLQTGSIDAATKANIYKTQVLSAAVASGNQADLDKGLQTLQAQGIDTSDVPNNIQQAAQWAQAGRQAQSPLGTLFNAATKMDANANTATTAAGGVPAGGGNAMALSLLKNGTFTGGIPVPIPTSSPAPTNNAPVPQPPAPSPIPATSPLTVPEANSVNIINGGAADTTPIPSDNGFGNMLNNAKKPTSNAANTIPQFSFRAQRTYADGTPSESIAAYNEARQQAFEQYKANPAYIQASAAASEAGKAQADATKAAVGAGANYDQVVQTVNGIKDLNHTDAGLPQDRYGIPAAVRTWANQNFGDQKLADNANAFTKLNEAQTIGAIKELASTGQIRMTRTLENILNRGYLIEPGASQASKDQQANLILAELNNSKIAAQNVDAGLNGGQPVPLQQMPSAPSTQVAAPSGGVLYGTSGGKLVYKMPDGSFLMSQ